MERTILLFIPPTSSGGPNAGWPAEREEVLLSAPCDTAPNAQVRTSGVAQAGQRPEEPTPAVGVEAVQPAVVGAAVAHRQAPERICTSKTPPCAANGCRQPAHRRCRAAGERRQSRAADLRHRRAAAPSRRGGGVGDGVSGMEGRSGGNWERSFAAAQHHHPAANLTSAALPTLRPRRHPIRRHRRRRRLHSRGATAGGEIASGRVSPRHAREHPPTASSTTPGPPTGALPARR